MKSDKKIIWKNPYEQRIRPGQLINLFNRTDQYFFSSFSITRPFVEGKQKSQCSFTEMELIKHLTHKKIYTNTRKLCIIGGFLFSLLVCYDYYKNLEIRDKLADPKAGPYIYPMFFNIWWRHLTFQFTKFEQTKTALFQAIYEKREMNKQFQIEDWRLQSLKQEQINNYKKKRDDLLDFLNIGEDENFNLI